MDIDNYRYRLYLRKPGSFDTGFIYLCMNVLGMNQAGALEHHNMLEKHCPWGFKYVCRVKKNSDEHKKYGLGYKYVVVLAPCFGDNGEPLPDYLYAFERLDAPVMPWGHVDAKDAPEDIELDVCWGSVDTDINYGKAKRVGDQWYIYGQDNPHANRRTCLTPTGWSKSTSGSG